MSELLHKTVLSPIDIQKFVHTADNPVEYAKKTAAWEMENRKVARKVYTKYKIYPPDFPSQREDAYTEVRKDIIGYKHIYNPIKPERRIVGTELIGLYELMVIGKIDTLYEKWLLKTQGYHLPSDEVKTRLAQQYLAHIHRKDKEQELYDAGVPITVGFEVEYNDPAITKMNYLKTKADPHVSLRSMVEMYKWGFNAIKDWRILSDGFMHNLKQNAPVTNSIQHRGLTPTNIIDGATREGADNLRIRELQTIPSHSLKMQLRELIKLRKMGGLQGNWIMHQTIAGIELTREHTEIMDALCMTVAAGYSGMTLKPEDIFKIEQFPKVTSDYTYYPYMLPRQSSELKSYGKNMQSKGVEIRLFQNYKQLPDHISQLIRSSTFLMYASYGIQAVQFPDRYMHNAQIALEWNTLMEKWQNVLSMYQLRNPEPSERYLDVPNDFTSFKESKEYISNQKLPYMKFHADLIRKSNTSSLFRHETQQLIIRYNARVKKIIGV